ncbi:MAG: S1C family serine protease [Phycisphaerae bacterium]
MDIPPPFPEPAAPAPRRLPLLVGILIGLLGGWLVVTQVRGRAAINAAPRAITPRGDLTASEKTTIQIFEEAAPSVVFITTRSSRTARIGFELYEIPQEGAGSGFIWDQSGHIVTNFHVIEGAQKVKVILGDHSSWNAAIVGKTPDKDLAVLRIDAPASRLKPIAIGSSRDLRVGQSVFAIGNPFGLDQTLTTGIVSALGRTIPSQNRRRIEDVIQTDAAINPGNSGGPLLDSAGRLIGMNTMIMSKSGSSAGIGFAVPVDTINRYVPQLIEYGRAVRPRLGVGIANEAILRRLGVKGLLIATVEPGSGADAAGLRGIARAPDGSFILGDIIQEIDGKPVNTMDDLLTILEQRKAGDRVTITYLRGDEHHTTHLQLQAPVYSE